MNELMKFWKNKEQFFTDCRLDSYYQVMQYLRKDIDSHSFFVTAQIVNEQCMIVNMRYKGYVIKTPILINSERDFEEELCSFWGIRYQNRQFHDADHEICMMKELVDRNVPVIVEMISLFLQEKNLKQEGIVISGISTVAVIGYDKSGFILGTKKGFSNELIHISYEQYRKARLNKCIPYMPRKGIVVLGNEEGKKGYQTDIEIEQLWLRQLKKLYNLNGLAELNFEIEQCLNGLENIGKDEELKILKTQLAMIAKSLCKGSYAGFYYELAKSGFHLGYITETQMHGLKEIGLVWKKCYFKLEQIIHNYKEKQDIEKFREMLAELILIKQKYLKNVIKEEGV